MKPDGRRRMLVLCPFPYGVQAGQRLKFEQYYDDWRAHGWDIHVAPFADLRLWEVLYDRGHLPAKVVGTIRGYWRRLPFFLRAGAYDLVYCHMHVTPLGSSVPERIIRRRAKRLVFDVEDNVLVGQPMEKKDHPNWLVRVLRGKGKARYLVRTADHVITSSPSLNEQCRLINEKGACTYISSSIDADRFQPANRFANDGPLTIGWTGTFSSRPYLDALASVFQRLAKQREFKLRVIGNFDYSLPGVDLEVVRWTREREVIDLQAIDIGVYPLPAHDWVGGKSGLKAITYMMMGLPCVATDIGTTPLIIRDNENGLLVRTDEEWLAALNRLLDDPELRRRLGQQARDDAVEKYSTRAIAAEYRAVLDSVMGR
jgi:glycosyltransferase involved in cell wall biosynthesis